MRDPILVGLVCFVLGIAAFPVLRAILAMIVILRLH